GGGVRASGAGASRGGVGDGGPMPGGGADFGDLFEDLFGRAGAGEGPGGFHFGAEEGLEQRGPTRGEDLRTRVQLSLSEAVSGTEKTLSITRPGRCPVCGGT